jgi:hypothetical protein
MTFRITGLAPDAFRPLFTMSDDQLAARLARRVIADAKPGFPCRVSLTYAEPGESLVLVHHEHQPAATPFRASHAIYVRAARERFDRPDTVPETLRTSLVSLRGFDAEHMLVDADVVPGAELEAAIARAFADAKVAYLHAHYARPGCYAARIDRV